MGCSFTKKEEFIRNLVSKYMQIENLKEKYQRELSKLGKKPQIDKHNKLASTIANLVMKYKQDEDVECIHLEVICDEEIEYNNLYYLYVVCNNTDIDALENKYKKDNTKYSRKDDEEELDGWLHIIAVPTYFYDETADYYEVAQNLLLTNDILYDKTGKYTQIKESTSKKCFGVAIEEFSAKGPNDFNKTLPKDNLQKVTDDFDEFAIKASKGYSKTLVKQRKEENKKSAESSGE